MASKPSYYSSDPVPIPSTSTYNPSLVVVLNKDLHRVRRVKLEILVVAIGVVQFQFLCNSTCKVIEGKKCLKVFSRKKVRTVPSEDHSCPPFAKKYTDLEGSNERHVSKVV